MVSIVVVEYRAAENYLFSSGITSFTIIDLFTLFRSYNPFGSFTIFNLFRSFTIIDLFTLLSSFKPLR